jgi:hypothetical protein
MSPKLLGAFERVELKAGESKSITLHVEKERLCYWDETPDSATTHGFKGWVVAAGERTFYLGSSSRDIRLESKVNVPAGAIRTIKGVSDLSAIKAVIARAERLSIKTQRFISTELEDARAATESTPMSEVNRLAASLNLKIAQAEDRTMITPTPTIYVDGPEEVFASDTTATYKFSMNMMPANVSAITLTFAVEDAYFTGQSISAVDGWGILLEGPWEQDGAFWLKTITFTKAGGTGAGDYAFFELVLNCKAAIGTTDVEVLEVSAATPGGRVLVKIAGPAVTDFDLYSRYDVNRDGTVDLADVAAAAFFFMANARDANWKVDKVFKDASGNELKVSPYRCDVNRDGVVDIADLIGILNNF